MNKKSTNIYRTEEITLLVLLHQVHPHLLGPKRGCNLNHQHQHPQMALLQTALQDTVVSMLHLRST